MDAIEGVGFDASVLGRPGSPEALAAVAVALSDSDPAAVADTVTWPSVVNGDSDDDSGCSVTPDDTHLAPLFGLFVLLLGLRRRS